MNQHLFLMRHGKSDWTADSEDDFSRPLNERGVEDAVRMGQWLLENEYQPEKIICSTATRTRSTAALVADQFKQDEIPVSEDERLYLCANGQLLDVIEAGMQKHQRLLVIGHNPSMDEVVSHLCLEPPELTSTGKLMTTAAIAVFRYDKGYSPYEGELETIARPKEIE